MWSMVLTCVAHEDKSDDADHGDKSQDQRVFGETLATLVGMDEWEECEQLSHLDFRASFPQVSSAEPRVHPKTRTAGTRVGPGGPDFRASAG